MDGNLQFIAMEEKRVSTGSIDGVENLKMLSKGESLYSISFSTLIY
jgi:hypothetical protein